MSRYRLLVIDFDGTLAETLDDVVWCMKQTFGSYGFEAPDRDAVFVTVGLTLEDSFRRLRNDPFSGDELRLWTQAYRAFYKAERGRHSRPFPGVQQTLEAINELGLDILIVSNKGADAVETALQKFGLSELVTKTLGGDVTTWKKPNPALYFSEIKPLFPLVRDEEVLIVGDTKVDLEFAENAGATACWASYGYGKPEECEAMRPKFIIREFSDLTAIVK